MEENTNAITTMSGLCMGIVRTTQRTGSFTKQWRSEFKLKNTIPFLPGVDTNLACFDCEIPLELVSSWEPCLRLDTQTGDSLHVPICASCIAHLDEVYEHDVLRIVFKLAKRYRGRRDNLMGIEIKRSAQ